MADTTYTSKCCGSCIFKDASSPSLRCRRSRLVRLIVDAFYVCPLWQRGQEVARE